ncbi:DUF1080 domain-containing protein [Lewinella sp. 4G2]|uniref:3-keto-disaccharide hydrolase n=1 Tax=Lewinella sp. 4G2 TaxID=1803372 RepID=UPI0007B4F53E|nr:DUF1080 domain-containing protein [Lewinella sp. 4G2]OAV43077.1 glycosyl hydrolase [Lewinella sp. 4G2]
MFKKCLLFVLPFAILVACGETAPPADADTTSANAKAEEMTTNDDWKPLFNGQDLSGWHKYGGGEPGAAWVIDEGAIHLKVGDKEGWQASDGGDIITDEAYGNYELELEWKIGECGNSGIIYNVQETDEYEYPWKTGPEMQVLDNTCHPDAEIETHRAGDLYDMVSVRNENVKPAGEWNVAKLIVSDGKVEHWLNGEQQVVYSNTGEDWKEMIAASKFKDMPNWGMFTEGKISLQDHGDPVWFRNIRIREISK